MLTYRFQKRRFKITEGTPSFPSDVRVEMLLGPPTPFGAGVGGGRTATRATPAEAEWNPNTDRSTITAASASAPVNVTLRFPESNLMVSVKGPLLMVEATCKSAEDLAALVESVYHVFPAILNVTFADPPIVHHVLGTIGQAHFRWQLTETRMTFRPTTTEDQEKSITESLECMLSLFGGGKHRRLVAALHYFHVASRLEAAGDSPWEFMGEVILNLAKTLQALFGDRGEDVKAGLRALGYSAVEGAPFLTVMELRDTLDSGHIMLSVMQEEQARDLYVFIYGLEARFRALLNRVLDGTRKGTFHVAEHTDLALDARKLKLFQWIREANAANEPGPAPTA